MTLITTNISAQNNKRAYDFTFISLEGKSLELSNFKNKVIIVVNVASQCGFTNQYNDMQKIWDNYQDKGVIMLGVPSNDFNQEQDNNSAIKTFCETNFGITFPMTEKVSVKGSEAHPFYKWAKDNYGKSAVPKWNFHKIIIDKSGNVAETFSSLTNPSSKRFISAIEKLI